MRAEFEQYRANKMDMERTKEKIKGMQCLTDTVTGSSVEYPFTKHKMTVCGRNAAEEEKLRDHMADLLCRIQKVERLKDSIKNTNMRLMLELKYMDDTPKSWDEVADAMQLVEKEVSGGALRKRADKFFSELSKNS